MSHLNFWILAFFANFCPLKTDLSGNTVWPQASGFQKLAKIDHFWHFSLTFVHSKRKRSSLRSQCWECATLFGSHCSSHKNWGENWYCWLRVLLLGRNPEEGWQEELDRNANGIQYSPRTQDIASGFSFSWAFQKWKLSRKSINESGTFLSSKEL